MKEAIDKGDQCVQLNYDFKDRPIPQIVKALMTTWTNRASYPVITKVTKVSEDVVEIRRAIIYKDFYNSEPYPEEVIRIDRSKLNNSNTDGYVYEQYFDTSYKQDLTRLHP